MVKTLQVYQILSFDRKPCKFALHILIKLFKDPIIPSKLHMNDTVPYDTLAFNFLNGLPV